MQKRRAAFIRRTLRLLPALAALTLVFSTGIFWALAAHAPAGAHLAAVGPVSAADGFPVWYKDATGLRMQLCLDANDPLCGFLPGDIPDPTQPISFPGNFPEEAFYQLSGAGLTTGLGGKANGTFGLEAAFANGVQPGSQIVFGRVRFFIFGLRPNTEYTITHPYGVDRILSEPDPGNPALGQIRFTEDIGGLSGGDFALALNSRIGPFLRWDPAVAPAAPPGYLGDPDVPHPVTGSPFTDRFGQPQNYFRIEGPGIGAGSPDRCTTPGLNPDDCIETRAFSLMGKIAVNAGVDVELATYSRTAAGGGMVDVFAASIEAPQALEVSGTGFFPTRMQGRAGRYFARVAYTGAGAPGNITVTNTSDVPASAQTLRPVDVVTATAGYNADTQTLTVTAQSSDQVGAPALTVTGFGPVPAAGVLTLSSIVAPPARITVTSAAGGSITVPVMISGAAHAPIPVQAAAGADQTVLVGGAVTLNGTGSAGPITAYAWAQTAGAPVTLAGAGTATAAFTAPNVPGDLLFTLTVTGPGGPATSTVAVHVTDTAPVPVADAGPDQAVAQGAIVMLDGSASTGATQYNWEQVAGVAVVLRGATTAQPTFTSPKQSGPLTFRLTASGPGGAATDTVLVTTAPGTVAITVAEFRTGSREWRIEGTSGVPGPDVTVTIHLGDGTAGPVLATANVDTFGAWRYRASGVQMAPDATRTITAVSSAGGNRAGPVTVRK